MKQGTEKNEINNEINIIPEELFQKALDMLNSSKERGFIDSNLYDLILADLAESYESRESNPKDSLGLVKKAMNRIEIAAENKGIKIDFTDIFSDIPSEILENADLIDYEEQRQSDFEKAWKYKSVEEKKEDESQKDESEGEGALLPYTDYSKEESVEVEIPEAPEVEIETFELEKDKKKDVEAKENDFFSIFEELEKRLGALNASAEEKQEIQTYLDAATDAILENNEEDANFFLSLAETEIDKLSNVAIGKETELQELEEEIEDTSEEEEDISDQGAPLLFSEYLEESAPEAEIPEAPEAKTEIVDFEIKVDEIADYKKKEEELLKYKEYTTAIGFVNSKFLDFFEQEKYISSEEKEKVAVLLECAYDALKEAKEAEDEEEKLARYEEALESANIANGRMDKVLKDSGEKERGKTRFAQIVRISEIQKAERRKYFAKKKEEDRIKTPKKRAILEKILGKAGILRVDEEDEFSRKKLIMTPEIKEFLKKVERYEKEAEPVYKQLKENEDVYSVSEDDFSEFKRLAFNIIRENQNIVNLTNKEEEKEWENMLSSKKIVEENAPSVDIEETGKNIFYQGKDTKAIKYLEKSKELKLPGAFKRAYEKAEYERDERGN